MAIAFDAATDGGSGGADFSHTCTGSNRLLFVGVWVDNSAAVTGVTYSAVSMTQAVSKSQGTRTIYLFYLVAPATGSNTVHVATSGSPLVVFTSCISYTGARQGAQPDQTASNSHTTGTSATLSQSITTAQDLDWVIGYAGCGNEGVANLSSWTAGLTGRVTNGNKSIADTNAAVTPAGSVATTVTFSDSTDSHFLVLASLAPKVDLTVALTQGAYTLTGQTLALFRSYTVALSQGAYALSGGTLSFVNSLWTRLTKNTSTFSDSTKNSTVWTDATKDTSSFTSDTKH